MDGLATIQKKKIMEMVKTSPFMSDATWAAEQKRMCGEVDANFKAANGDAAEAEEVLDPFGRSSPR